MRLIRRVMRITRGSISSQKAEPIMTHSLLTPSRSRSPWILLLIGLVVTAALFWAQNLNISYWMVLPVGFAATLLLALVFHAYISERDRMERALLERTASLEEQEHHLEDLVRERTQSLEWKSAFLEALIDSSSDGILVVDNSGAQIFQNRRNAELWKMPPEIAAGDDSENVVDFVTKMVKNSDEFAEKVRYLYDHPDEHARDEITLVDGTILDRFSSPVWGKDGTYYGRIWSFHDITELRAAEKARIGATFQLRDALDLARIAYWEANPRTFEYTFNDAFYELYGTTAEREGGYRVSFEEYFQRFIHPDDLQWAIEQAKRSAEEGADFTEVEHRGVRRDGQVLHIITHARNARDDSGQVVRIFGTNQDITERKMAERVITESESKFRALSEKSIVGIYLTQDGIFKYVNTRFAEIHGYAPEEMVDTMSIGDTIYIDDAETFVDPNVGDLDASSRSYQQCYRITTKQGEVRHVEVYASRMVYLGKEAIIGTLLDVTERKKTEELICWKTAFLEAQLNSSLDGVLVIDNQGKTILQNQRIIEMWHIPQSILDSRDEREQLTHVLSLTKNPEKFRARVIELHNHPDETGRDEIALKDGTVFDAYSCPVVGEDGSHYGRIWTFRDITELRHYWDMLENLSATDGLTELSNRRRFDEVIDREWRRAQRDQSMLSLILMDIDFFKEFNDNYGHLAGDDCLRQVANVLRNTVCRPGDLVARYGGEEFVCVLPETDSEGAVALAYKIKEQIGKIRLPHLFSSAAKHLTLSFGVVSIIPGKGQTTAYVIQLADELLYAAKQGGRDQVRSWGQTRNGRRINAV